MRLLLILHSVHAAQLSIIGDGSSLRLHGFLNRNRTHAALLRMLLPSLPHLAQRAQSSSTLGKLRALGLPPLRLGRLRRPHHLRVGGVELCRRVIAVGLDTVGVRGVVGFHAVGRRGERRGSSRRLPSGPASAGRGQPP